MAAPDRRASIPRSAARLAAPAPDGRLVPFARELVATGERVELHGTVGHHDGLRTAAVYLGVAALASLMGRAWPLPALLLFGLVVASGAVDLNGGRGLLRRFIPREIGQTVLAWRPVDKGSEPRPCFALVIPAEGRETPPTLPAWSWIAVAVLLGFEGIALGLALADADFARTPLNLALAGTSCAALVVGLGAWWRGQRGPASVGLACARGLLRVLSTSPLRHHDLVLVVTADGMNHADALEILLLNHERRLSRERTRVLAWQPPGARLAAVGAEGRIRPLPSPPPLLQALAGTGIEVLPKGLTPAARARRLGWSSLGFVGGLADPRSSIEALHRYLLALDGEPVP